MGRERGGGKGEARREGREGREGGGEGREERRTEGGSVRVKVGTKRKIYMETCMFLCFGV